MSDRKFGLFFGAALAVLSVALWLLFGVRSLWLPVAAGLFALAALLCPGLLLPLNRGWMVLAHLLGTVNNRLILGIVFILVITPVGLLMRAMGRNPMNLKLEPGAASYLSPVERQTDTDTMRDIF